MKETFVIYYQTSSCFKYQANCHELQNWMEINGCSEGRRKTFNNLKQRCLNYALQANCRTWSIFNWLDCIGPFSFNSSILNAAAVICMWWEHGFHKHRTAVFIRKLQKTESRLKSEWPTASYVMSFPSLTLTFLLPWQTSFRAKQRCSTTKN